MQPRPGHTDGLAAPGVIAKWDNATGDAVAHDFGPSDFPDESVFVRRSDAAEDDGYVLSFVYDRSRDTSDLVILDASDIAAALLAVVHLPRRVPHGFHGSWIADS